MTYWTTRSDNEHPARDRDLLDVIGARCDAPNCNRAISADVMAGMTHVPLTYGR